MRVLAVVLLLFAGCASPEPTPAEPTPAPEIGIVTFDPQVLGVTSAEHADVAQAAALAWDAEARLTLVAAFEGELPAWSQNAVTGGNRWTDPFVNVTGRLGDGLHDLWAYSFSIDGPVHDVAMRTCEVHTLAGTPDRGFVVIVDGDGAVVSSFDATDDEEGALVLDFLNEGIIDSQDAARAAIQDDDYRGFLLNAVWSRTFLAEWVPDHPEWAITLYTADDDRLTIIVDAVTGQVSSGNRSAC